MASVAPRSIVRAVRLVADVSATRWTARLWTCLSCSLKQQPYSQNSRRAIATTAPRRQQHDESNGLTPAATSTTLPSYSAKQRSPFTKRVSDITDSILARASIAGQHINTYTGTDYSGIEALRRDISERETEVKTRHAAVTEAKSRHTEARVKQASSQKEIVALLERKSSWSPGDLERYMSLVRSEHIDDQAVQKAAEELTLAERELEGTRSLLEKLERKQYHEEQIWSDTIRRNSTWVTIGLMGVNIVLLLAQISIFEPYRRRKIVKQIEQALDERTALATQNDDLVREVDMAFEPQGVTLEELEVQSYLEAAAPAREIETAAPEAVLHEEDLPVQELGYLDSFLDLFSEELIPRPKYDITMLALESMAAGITFGILIATIFIPSYH